MLKTYNHEHKCPFEAYITNLGKYNEGELVGRWVQFPTDEDTLSQVMQEIGINEEYEEFFITDYDCYVSGLYNHLGEYESIEMLNELAEKIEAMNTYEYETFTAVLENEYFNSIQDIIDINLDNYDYIQDIKNDYDLGYYYIEECGLYNLSSMGNLSNYIDYERFGRDVRFDEGGSFTENGYLRAY